MIRDLLIPAVLKAFPESGVRVADPPDPIAVFPALNNEVGDVIIWDDGDEATVLIGEITHGHFNPCDPKLTPRQMAERVTEDVIHFLENLFADSVLLWKSKEGGTGGWRVLGNDDELSLMDSGNLTYVWSGPVRNPEES